MRTLRARCTACGEVTLSPDEITVSETQGGRRVTCSFACPECGAPCEHTFGMVAGRMLLLSGATTTPVAHPPLTQDDIGTLRALMDQPDFVTRMRNAA